MVNDKRSLVKDKRNLVNDKKSNEGIKRPITKEGDVQTLAFRQRVFHFSTKYFFLLAITYDVYDPKRGKGPWSRGHSPGSPVNQLSFGHEFAKAKSDRRSKC